MHRWLATVKTIAQCLTYMYVLVNNIWELVMVDLGSPHVLQLILAAQLFRSRCLLCLFPVLITTVLSINSSALSVCCATQSVPTVILGCALCPLVSVCCSFIIWHIVLQYSILSVSLCFVQCISIDYILRPILTVDCAGVFFSPCCYLTTAFWVSLTIQQYMLLWVMQLCAMVQLSFLTCVFLRCLCCCYSFLFFSVVCLSAVLWFCWQTFVVMVFSGLTVLFYNVHCTRCRSHEPNFLGIWFGMWWVVCVCFLFLQWCCELTFTPVKQWCLMPWVEFTFAPWKIAVW